MKNERYFMVKNNIFKLGLKPIDLSVLMYLIRCENNADGSYPSYNNIALNTSISKRSAMKSIKFLAEVKIISKEIRRTTREELNEKLEGVREIEQEYYKILHSNLNKSNKYNVIHDFDNEVDSERMFIKVKLKYAQGE